MDVYDIQKKHKYKKSATHETGGIVQECLATWKLRFSTQTINKPATAPQYSAQCYSTQKYQHTEYTVFQN